MDPRKLKTQQDYSTISQLYIEDFGEYYEHFELINKLINLLNKNQIQNKPVVDLGCGPGQVTNHLYQKGLRNIIAIDFVPEFTQYVKQFYSNKIGVAVINQDIETFVTTQKNDSIAAYIDCFSLMHIPNENIDSVYNNIYQSLITKGLFLTACHQGKYKGMETEPYQAQKDSRLKTNKKLEIYMNYFQENELKERIGSVGFNIKNSHTFKIEDLHGSPQTPQIWLIAEKS
jgi:SAM-dependent methyltransferase